MNTTKIHTIKMRLETIRIKLMDLDNRIERANQQKAGLRDVSTALQLQLDAMVEQAEKAAAAAAVIVPQEPA